MFSRWHVLFQLSPDRGEYAADGEEAGLHNCVYPASHPSLFSDIIGIDNKETQFLFDYRFLDFTRQVVPDLILPVDAVSRKTPPGTACLSTSNLSRNENWWQATNWALLTSRVLEWVLDQIEGGRR